ncbi:hypothetical protein [Bacillus sp. JCM 19041]
MKKLLVAAALAVAIILPSTSIEAGPTNPPVDRPSSVNGPTNPPVDK